MWVTWSPVPLGRCVAMPQHATGADWKKKWILSPLPPPVCTFLSAARWLGPDKLHHHISLIFLPATTTSIAERDAEVGNPLFSSRFPAPSV